MLVGFEVSVSEKLTEKDKRALILGTGGSSKAVAWVLQKKGIDYLWVSRNKTGAPKQISYEDLDEQIMQTHTLIINSTPLGMYPDTEIYPPNPLSMDRHGTLSVRPGLQSGKNIIPE